MVISLLLKELQLIRLGIDTGGTFTDAVVVDVDSVEVLAHAKALTTKDDLIVKVWGYDSNAVDNNVEVYISFLRKKIEFISSSAQISSLRKIGYRLEDGADAKKA